MRYEDVVNKYNEIDNNINNRENRINKNNHEIKDLVKEYKRLISPSVVAASLTGGFVVFNAAMYLFTGSSFDALLANNKLLEFLINTFAYLPVDAVIIVPVTLVYSKVTNGIKSDIKDEIKIIKNENNKLTLLNDKDSVKLNKLNDVIQKYNNKVSSVNEEKVNSNNRVKKLRRIRKSE